MRVLFLLVGGGLVTGALGRRHLVRGAGELSAHQGTGSRVRAVGSGGQNRRVLVLPQRARAVHDVCDLEGALVGLSVCLSVGLVASPLESAGRARAYVQCDKFYTRYIHTLRQFLPIFSFFFSLGLVWFCPVPFAFVWFLSVPFRFVCSFCFRLVPFGSVRFHSVSFRSVWFRSVPFGSFWFRWVPVGLFWFGWFGSVSVSLYFILPVFRHCQCAPTYCTCM